jgi:sugar (pentulose or hexulose) kinase
VTALALGVDLGSHGARAVVTEDGVVVAGARSEFGLPRPPARRAASAWWDAFTRAVTALDPGVRTRVDALAVTGVRGAVVGVDEHNAPVTPGYPDFDVDAIPTARVLVERYGEEFLARTACFAFPLAGLPKMMLHAGDAHIRSWLGPPDFVGARLTGRTTLSTASAFRFGILRADAADVDRDLLADVGVDPNTIPTLVAVGEWSGQVDSAHANALGLRAGIPVVAAPGDVPAALYAVTGDRPGCAFVNLGTTIVATTVVPDGRVVPGMSCEVLSHGNRAVETGSGAGVVTLEWCAALLGTTPEALESHAADAIPDAIPELDPELLDPWGEGRGGALRRVVPETGRAEIAAATLTAVAGAATRAVDELVAGAGRLERVIVGGGASNCPPIVERLARTRREVIVIASGRELAAEGAARVAAESATR